MLLTTFTKNDAQSVRAEVYETSEGYRVIYYNQNQVMNQEEYPQKNIQQVQHIVENWLQNVKVLHG